MSSSVWLDDVGLDAAEYDDSEAGELYDDSEYDDSEYDDSEYDDSEYDDESRKSRAAVRRAAMRRRRIAVARRRRDQMRGARRGRRPVPRAATPRAAVKAIRNLDLDTKVQEDKFRTATAAMSRRMSRSEYAAVSGAAINQFIESFDAPDNAYFRAALRFSPLLLLQPQSRGKGFEGFVKDPRVVGGAAVAAITVIGENRGRLNAASSIDVLAANEIQAGQSDRFVADVFDRSGKLLDKDVTWSSDDTSVAEIDSATGKVTAKAAGTAVITAKFGDVRRRTRLTVSPAASGTK